LTVDIAAAAAAATAAAAVAAAAAVLRYITVDEEAGRALFYVFAEARTAEASKAPLMLWLNG
jgi:hypothetical protein